MSSLSVRIAALVLAKAVLIADMLPIINRYPEKPLIYNIAWKALIYLIVSLLVHYLERLSDFWRETGDFLAGNERLVNQIEWPHFWAIQIILLVWVLMYCTMRELIRVIGGANMSRIFFGPLPTFEQSVVRLHE